MDNLETIEITLKDNRKFKFLYPKAEKGMIFSVLQGDEYPLSNVKIKSRNPIILDLGSNFGSSIVYFKDNYPNSTIYGLMFGEAGNSWSNYKNFHPFELRRSLGLGVRIFMPMFGLLGIDFAYGFDNLPNSTVKSGWQTHFIIGQQF